MRAVRNGDQRPRAPCDLVHGLAGRHRHRHLAHQGPDPRGACRSDPRGVERRLDRAGRRVSGGLDQPRRDHARSGRLGHDRGGAGGRDRRRGVRDLHRRGGGVHRGSAAGAERPQVAAGELRGDARDGGVRGQGPAAAVGRVRSDPRRPDPLPIEFPRDHRYLRNRRRRDDGAPPDHRSDPFDRRGEDHVDRGSRPPRRGRSDLPGARGRELQRRHDHPERAA